MKKEQKDSGEEAKELERQVYIGEIRARSVISASTLRRRKFKLLPPYSHPSLIRLYDPKLHVDEDRERDLNMVTSADVLDLYTSELRDSEIFGPGNHSERTQELARRVASGLAWAIDNELRFEAIHNEGMRIVLEAGISGIGPKAKDIRDRLTSKEDSRDLMVAIDQVLGLVHRREIFRSPLKDLLWEPHGETAKLLNFLKDDHK